MSYAVVHTRALRGLESLRVAVEVHLSAGLPSLSIVGMAETAVRESKERVRSAIINSEFDFPARRITINLAPADLPKQGGQFDLPIALGILMASNQLPSTFKVDQDYMGELGLDGQLRPVRGCLPAALSAATDDLQLFCPRDNAIEASLSQHHAIYPADSLLTVCAHITGQTLISPMTLPETNTHPDQERADLTEVKGQVVAKRALEIAAAGHHHLLMQGPPGTGKSLLARRLSGLMPPLTVQQAMEVACIRSISHAEPLQRLPGRPCFSPHHSASAAALVGGGSPPYPGEISLCHNGILFLDELPEFKRSVLEVLREPLETGQVRISRAKAQTDFPAQFLMVCAMNPCPCGYYKAQHSAHTCRCTADQVRRYQSKISGPLLDRIDLHVSVSQISAAELLQAPEGESSATVRARVEQCQRLQIERQSTLNGLLSPQQLQCFAPLDNEGQQLLQRAEASLGLSARALHRTLKLARTIADLAASERIESSHLIEAIGYRGYQPNTH